MTATHALQARANTPPFLSIGHRSWHRPASNPQAGHSAPQQRGHCRTEINMMHRRHFLCTSALALGLPQVWAQSAWPKKPVRVVIPYAAGGVTDSVGRKLVEKMGQALGQSFFVENKGGAGGTLGIADVAKAAPDGYTLALSAISPLDVVTLPDEAALIKPFKDVVAVAPDHVFTQVYVLATSSFLGKSWNDSRQQAAV